jgi:hypothetical protein
MRRTCTHIIPSPRALRVRYHLRSGDFGPPVLGAISPPRGGSGSPSLGEVLDVKRRQTLAIELN